MPLAVRVSLLCLGLAIVPSPARADKTTVVVLPFSGPQARKAEAAVTRTLKRVGKVVPGAVYMKTAKKLHATSRSNDDIVAVAGELGIEIVVTGMVKRDRGWSLTVQFRNGANGKVEERLRYSLKGPRITPGVIVNLISDSGVAFANVKVSITSAESEPEAPAAPEQPAPIKPPPPGKPVAQKPKGKAPPEQPPPPPEPAATAEQQPGEEEGKEAPKEDANRRPKWAPYFSILAGGSISTRSFEPNPSSFTRFRPGATGGLRIDLTVNPFAFSWKKAGGVLAGLGIFATLDKPFWVPSRTTTDPDLRLNTQELRFEGGLRWRFVLYKKIPRPELVVLFGGGLHSFTIDKIDDMGVLRDAGPPDVNYQYLTVGGGLRLWFSEWAIFNAQFNYHAVLAAGNIQEPDKYGAMRLLPIRIQGGFDFLPYKGLMISLMGFYERYQLSVINPALSGPQGAVDQYYGGVLSLGYML